MARIFITGSADGLGRLAAEQLTEDGHQVVVHARTSQRLTTVRDLLDGGATAVVGDLSDPEQTRASPPRSTASARWTPSSTTPA
jgi:NAD(P)-dependent dehydrogenase (short-subunit alcohol dehydrogenase family)